MDIELINNINDLYDNFNYFLEVANPNQYDFNNDNMYKEYIDEIYQSIDFYFRSLRILCDRFYNDKYINSRIDCIKEYALRDLVKCNYDMKYINKFYDFYIKKLDKDFITLIIEEKYDDIPHYAKKMMTSINEIFSLMIKSYKYENNHSKKN